MGAQMKSLINSSLLAAMLILIANLVQAAPEPVGKVILSIGKNVAQAADGSVRSLRRQADIYSDDLLRTSDRGRLQIRFSDGSRLSLKPATEFRIAEYRFEKDKPEEGRAFYKLLKGGMRTISGQIGKVDRDDYRLETVVATIGIRGTDYEVNTRRVAGKPAVSGQVHDGKILFGGKLVPAGNSFDKIGNGPVEVFRTGSRPAGQEGESSGQEDEEDQQEEDQQEGDQQDGDQQEGDQQEGDQQESGEQAQTQQSDQTRDSGVDLATTATTTGNATGDSGLIPAADPNSEQSPGSVIASPNPTGNGTAAPAGSFTGVAFTEYETGKGLQAGNGSVLVDGSSALTLDNNGTAGDLVTGILYVDPNPNTSDEPCAPCSLTGPGDITRISDQGSTSIGGAQVSWGRWNAGFSLVENGVQQETAGSFHFMYSDSRTSSEQLAAVATAKSGSYLYTFSGGSNNLTSPETETGATGSLVNYAPNAGSNGRLYQGTYVLVNWDTQTVDQVSIEARVNDGTGVRAYQLRETTNASTGEVVQPALNTLLNGGDMKLTGTCSGGQCTVGGNDTSVGGRMTFELVGSAAEGAVTTYGASGTSPGGSNVTVTGTALLNDGGAAP